MPPVVVLGAAGFIGRALVRRLAADGYAVTAVTRRPRVFAENVAVIETGDLKTDSAWARALQSAAAVVHLASAPTARGSGPAAERWIEAEAETARRVAKEIARARVAQAILLSSIMVHGEETGGTPFRADHAPAPATAYARAKLRIEKEMSAVLGDGGTALAVLRPPLVYGAEVGPRFRILLGLVAHAPVLPFASIRNRRSLLYRENLVDLVAHMLRRPKPTQGIFLVRDDEELSTPELVRRIGAGLGHIPALVPCPPALLRLGGVMTGNRDLAQRLTASLQLDDGAARREFEWRPPHAVDAGFAEMGRWFLDRQRQPS